MAADARGNHPLLVPVRDPRSVLCDLPAAVAVCARGQDRTQAPRPEMSRIAIDPPTNQPTDHRPPSHPLPPPVD